MATALITGGTSGIGAAFAGLLAGRGYGLVLVARDLERLERVAAELHASSGMDVEVLRADLGDRTDVARVAARLEDAARPIDILINCAGFGVHTPLIADPERHERAFDVMCRAILVLGGAAGRSMSARGHGTIISISSLQSFLTTGSYAAIKAWVTAYSQGLASELRPAGVTVTAVLPGWVRTEWHERAGVQRSSIPSWLWIDPGLVARVALQHAERGKVISIPTVRYRVIGWLARHLPMGTIRRISERLTASRNDSSETARAEHRAVNGAEQT